MKCNATKMHRGKGVGGADRYRKNRNTPYLGKNEHDVPAGHLSIMQMCLRVPCIAICIAYHGRRSSEILCPAKFLCFPGMRMRNAMRHATSRSQVSHGAEMAAMMGCALVVRASFLSVPQR